MREKNDPIANVCGWWVRMAAVNTLAALRDHKCNQRRSVARKYLANRVRDLKPHDRRVARRLIEVAHKQFPHLTKARGRPASIGNSESAAATGGTAENGAATGYGSMSYIRGE
jgi:hypothetical protein